MTTVVYSSGIVWVSFFEVFAELLPFFFVGRRRLRSRSLPREAGVLHFSLDMTKRVLDVELVEQILASQLRRPSWRIIPGAFW
jgi:hypothetical protein